MVNLEKTLFDLCQPLVEDKDSLSVKTMSSTNDNEILLYVYANSEDVARLIGRRGSMARVLYCVVFTDSKNQNQGKSIWKGKKWILPMKKNSVPREKRWVLCSNILIYFLI